MAWTMTALVRALVPALLMLARPDASTGQPPSVLHIKVVLVDAANTTTPVPHHALLISENPASATPRRIVTTIDGTADVKLVPGNYTVESDRPVTFGGKTYQWTEVLDIAPGRDAVLELTSSNAEVAPAATMPGAAPALESDPSFLLTRWQNSVVTLWTPTARASGFVVDERGLIATAQRAIGAATTVEVELTPALKVPAAVLTADAARDVAILWIDPKTVAAMRPLPLGCTAVPVVVAGQEIFAIGARPREPKVMAFGTVSRVASNALASDLVLARGAAGGPVFTAAGAVAGISSLVDSREPGGREDATVIRVDSACLVLAAAETKIKDGTPPNGTPLPMEPARPFPVAALESAAKGRAGSLSPYQISSSDFDVAFITPVLTFGAKYQEEQLRGRERRTGGRLPASDGPFLRPLMDFANWSAYVAEFPPVLLVRVTPRLVESFWTTVARGAARTQGVSLPPIKHYRSGFARLRAFCGDAEVIPIHPFKLEQRVSETDAIYEGLYVFDPAAFGPHCAGARLVLVSDKTPEKEDTRTIDPKVLEQIWSDFAPYRTTTTGK